MMNRIKKVTIIIGLPGSGKTTLATSLCTDDCFLIDDLCLDINGLSLAALDSGRSHIIITDPKFCASTQPTIKNMLIKNLNLSNDVEFSFIYFDNEPEQCIINSRISPKPGGTENFIKTFTKLYRIPKNADIRPVYKE